MATEPVDRQILLGALLRPRGDHSIDKRAFGQTITSGIAVGSLARDEAPFDWGAWQARKQAAWEADQHALASGEKTREQLGRENGAVPEHIAKAPLSWDELLW